MYRPRPETISKGFDRRRILAWPPVGSGSVGVHKLSAASTGVRFVFRWNAAKTSAKTVARFDTLTVDSPCSAR